MILSQSESHLAAYKPDCYPYSAFDQFVEDTGILEVEKSYILSHYALYHASSQSKLYRDLIGRLQERKTGDKLPKDFVFLRVPYESYTSLAQEIAAELKEKKPSFKRFSESIDKLKRFLNKATHEDLKALYEALWPKEDMCMYDLGKEDLKMHKVANLFFRWASEISGIWYTCDHMPSLKESLISANPSLYCDTDGESARSWWMHQRNADNIPTPLLLIEVLQHFNVPLDHLKELSAIEELVKPYDNAIVGIYFPMSESMLIHRSVYPAHDYGFPCEHLRWGPKGLPFLSACAFNVHNLPHIDNLQARLVVRKDDLLNPKSGIKIRVFDQIPEDILSEYNKRLDNWLSHLNPKGDIDEEPKLAINL